MLQFYPPATGAGKTTNPSTSCFFGEPAALLMASTHASVPQGRPLLTACRMTERLSIPGSPWSVFLVS
jgi:hypothetical protein